MQERDDRRRPSGKPAQRFAVAVVHRQWAVDAAFGEMLHQAEEEGEVGRVDPLLVEGEDELALLGREQVVGVLDALGDALDREHGAEIVAADEGLELLIGEIGVDRQAGLTRPLRAARAAG